MNSVGSPPELSVVMSVYNGIPGLERTINSILTQTITNFEFLIVNDGSSDGSLGRLREYEARDNRIRVIDKENSGLTASLDLACRQAKAPLVARQDVGDRSHPGRFQVQVEYLRSHPDVVAVGCGSRRLTEKCEFLGEVCRQSPPQEITRQLVEDGTGILHPASMFRAEAFNRVGGYRVDFRYAQDTDLWLRMIEVGLIGECPEILFDLVIDDHGISACRTVQQVKLWQIARKCYATRRRGEPEADLLAEARRVSESTPAKLSQRSLETQRCRAKYFIGSQLLAQRDPSCRPYFFESMRSFGLVPLCSYKLLLSLLRCR